MAERIRLNLSSNLRHPFVITPPAELATLKERVKAEPCAGYHADLIKSLESRESQPIADCPPGGLTEPPTAFHMIIAGVTQLAVDAAIVWHIDGNPRWLALAKKALAKAAAWEYWRAPVHLPLPADLTTAHTASDVGMVYDLLFDQLDTAERKAVQDAIIKHATAFIQPDTIDRYWWSWAHDGNWSFVTLGGMGMGTLAILPERPEVLPAVETAAAHIQRSLDHIGATGSWREGHGYMCYGLMFGHRFLDALAGAGDRRFVEHHGLKAMDDFYLFTMLTPRRQVYFGDNASDGGGAPFLYRRAALTRRGDLQHFNDSQRQGGSLGILYRDPTVKPTPARFDPPSRCWHDIGWAFLRSNWDNADTVTLAAKAGSVAGGHQHWDCGTFLLASHGKEIISEPGIGHYSRDYHRGKPLIKRTSVHNCLLIDGEEQIPEEHYRADITQFHTTQRYDMVKMDLTRAYNHRDLKQYNRFFFLLRPGLVVMVDEVFARYGHNQYNGTALESRLHTTCDIQVRPFDAVLKGDGVALGVRSLQPPYTPGLGDHNATMSIGEHAGLESRDPSQDKKLRYLSIRTECNGEPTLMVTAMLPGRSVEEVDVLWSAVKVERRRRRRVEVFYQGQTLVLDWGNRRWQTYWSVYDGAAPEVIHATIGAPNF